MADEHPTTEPAALSSHHHSAVRHRHARQRKPWRLAFIGYAIALFVGTHWPALALPEQAPATDKTIHAIAFAILTWLLWRTGWMRSRLLVTAVAAAWAVLDESSQMLPLLNRYATWQDVVANLCGVAVVGAWLWALQPIGGAANRWRIARQQYLFDRVTSDRRVIMSVAALCAPIALALIIMWTASPPHITRLAIIAACIIVPHIMLAVLWVHWRRTAAHLPAERPCFACDTKHLAEYARICPTCSAPLHPSQWQPSRWPTAHQRSIVVGRLALFGIGIVLLIFAFIWLLPDLHQYLASLQLPMLSSLAASISEQVGRERSLVAVIDLTILLLLFAGAARIYRQKLSRHFDQHLRCRACGQDLRGTPTQNGQGRCSECGTSFVV